MKSECNNMHGERIKITVALFKTVGQISLEFDIQGPFKITTRK